MHTLHNDMILSAIDELRTEMLALSGKGEEPCSLAKDPGHPGDNWVTESGGLPAYICNVAKEIKKSGKDTSTAIAMAVSQIKKWIADPKTTAETKAKATAAIADWERKKGQSHAHATVKAAADKANSVKASADVVELSGSKIRPHLKASSLQDEVVALSKTFAASDFHAAHKDQKCSRWQHGDNPPAAVKCRESGGKHLGACAKHAKEMTASS